MIAATDTPMRHSRYIRGLDRLAGFRGTFRAFSHGRNLGGSLKRGAPKTAALFQMRHFEMKARQNAGIATIDKSPDDTGPGSRSGNRACPAPIYRRRQ